MFMLTGIVYAQTITIDYEAWNPSNPPCRIFSGITNVPATGATGGTIQHITSAGQPFYNTTDKSVQIQTTYVAGGAGTWKGGSFRIYYNFKNGYSYTIYVTAAAVENTLGNQFGPYFRLDVDNVTGGLASNAACNGAEQVTQNLSGNPAAQKLSDNAMAEFQYIMPPLGTQSTLNITAIPAQDGGTKTVRIRKIKIEETPPPVSFTLANPISVICGKANPVVLTVTNVYSTPGVTGYTWNLGATNKWIYNGSPAPATISTTASTLTLSPICGTTPTSVSATANAGANSYTTNTATVTSVNETLSIIGTNPLCSGSATYSIDKLPTCGATVSNWNATPSGIVQVTNNGNTATVTKLANGQVTLTATVSLTNACNTSTVNLSLPLSSGVIPLTGYYRIASDYYNYGIFNPLYNNNSPIWLPANKIFGIDVSITSTGIQSPAWTRASNSYPFTWSTTGTFLTFSGTSGTTAYSQRNGIFELTANTGCGVTTTTFTWPVVVQGGSFSVTASPNPATDNLSISIESETVTTKASGKTANIILTLYNLTSTEVVKRWSFKNNQTKFNLNVSGIKKGIYILKVNRDKQEQTKQISIE